MSHPQMFQPRNGGKCLVAVQKWYYVVRVDHHHATFLRKSHASAFAKMKSTMAHLGRASQLSNSKLQAFIYDDKSIAVFVFC